MAINDNFVLEISAQIKKDTQKIVNDLKTTIKNIEDTSKINLEVDQKKVNEYIEKLKASLSEINSVMNNAGLEANSTAFRNFVDVLKEGASYSEKIGQNLKIAADVANNLDQLKNFNANTNSNSKTDDNATAKQLIQDNLNNLKKQLKIKTEIQKLYSSMANDMNKKTNGSEVIQSRQNQISSLYKELHKVEKEQRGIITNFKQIDSVDKLHTIDDLKGTKEYENFKKYLDKANLDLKKRNSILDNMYSKYSTFSKNEELYNSNKSPLYNKYVDDYQKTIDAYKSKIDSIKNSNVTNFNKDELIEYENELKRILELLNHKDFKNATLKNTKFLPEGTDLKSAEAELKKLIETQNGYIKKSYELKSTDFSKGIITATGLFKDQDGQIKKVTYSYNELTGAMTKTNATASKFSTFGDQIRKKLGDLGTYLLSFVSFYRVLNELKQGFNIIKELDTELTEMQRVSNESLSNLQTYAKNSFDIAKEIGSTGSEIQSSTADWMRLGKSLQEASELAKTTNVLMNVSEFESIDKATESMVSMTQAYQELDSMDIVNKLNLTGNNYSISTDELAQSLQKSASALKTAKNDFDEAIALTVAGNSVVQDPDSVAAGIRTISLRMTGTTAAKKELEEMGEEVDTVLTKSKLNDTLEMLTNIDSRGGISLLDDNGNYRSTAQVLMDLAERWQEIGEQDVKDGQNRQNALLEALAGKNRSNILASILNDPNLIKDVYNDVSTNYQGSAMKENEKYMESIEGHLEKLKNAGQDFWADDKNREFINNILDLTNGFVELTNAVGGAKVALAALFALFVSFKWKKEVSKLFEVIKSIGSQIIMTGNSTVLTNMVAGFSKNITKVMGKFKNLIAGTVETGAVEGAKLGSAQAVNGGLMNIANFLFTTPVGLAITAVGSAFIAKHLYDSYKEGLEEASDRVESTLSSRKTNIDNLNQFKENIPDLAKEYDSLKDGVSSTGENLSLTNDEFQRYHEITSQIASTCPELVSGYDSTGNAIINLTNSLEDLNSAYDETLKKEAISTFKDMDFDDVDKSMKNQEYKTDDQYDELLKDSKTKFFGYKNAERSRKIMSDYNEFVTDNFSYNKELLKNSNKATIGLASGKNQASVMSREALKDLSKSLAFNQEEYNATIQYFQESAFATTDEEMKKIYDSYVEYLQNTVSGFQNEIVQMKDTMIAKIQTNDKYYELDVNQRTQFDSLVQNLNETDYYKYEGSKVENLFNKYYEYIKSKNGSTNLSQLSNWESLLTGSSGTISENKKKINDSISKISNVLGLTEDSIKEKYSIDETILDTDENKVIDFYNKNNDNVIKSIQNDTSEQIEALREQRKSIIDEMKKKDLYTGEDPTKNVIFGNIDLNNRAVLKWTEESINKYKDAIKSWGENPEDLLGSISTVYGSSGEYDGIEIAFSPMLQTKNGAELLDADTVDNYINSLINEASKDGSWTNEELFKLDAEGLEINGKKIKGLIADIGETARETGEKMHYFGEDGAINLINKQIDELKNKKADVADFSKFSKEELENIFSPEELKNISENIGSIDSEKLKENFKTEFYAYYDDFKEYLLDVFKTISKIEESYSGKNKSFSDLETSTSSYSSALAQLNTLGNDNVNINTDLADSLLAMGDGFDKYIQKSEDGSTATITNTQAVKELIKTEQKKSSIDAKNSKSQAIKNYKDTTDTLVDLTDQLIITSNATGKLDESILNNINSTQSQLDVLKRNIQYYEQLEMKILGATDAFDAYNLALEQDESNNAYSTASSMLETLKSGFKSGMMGTEAFKSAIQGILSDSEYNELMNEDDLEKRVQKMKNKYNELKDYFKMDSEGNPSVSSIKNFVNDAYSKDLFTSNNLENFEIKKGTSIDDFVDKLGYSREIIYSMFEQIQKYNVDWGNSIFENLNLDEFANNTLKIEDATDAINDYNKERNELILKRNKYKEGSKEWDEITKKIDECTTSIVKQQKVQENLTQTNKKNVLEYFDISDQIIETEQNLSSYSSALSDLQKLKAKGEKTYNGQNIDELITNVKLDITDAQNKLGDLLTRKNELGEPVEVNLIPVKEDLENEIAKLEEEKVEIQSEIKTDLSDATIFKGENFLTGGLTLDIDKVNSVEKINSEIEKKKKTLNQINIALGIETDSTNYDEITEKVKSDLEDINEGATVVVKPDINSFNSTNKQLDEVKKKQDSIKQYLNVVTRHTVIEETIKQNSDSKATTTAIIRESLNNNTFAPPSASLNFSSAFGQNNSKSAFNYFGKAYANGKLGNISSHTSGNTLVGELGAETIVDPWEGSYKVVGINGAEFVKIPKDAIVFNHQQTKELQKTGKIKSRGAIVSNASGFMKGFAKASPYNNLQGNAFATIFSGSSSSSKSSKSNSSSSKSSNSNSSSSSETKGLLDDLFDWIEIKLQRLSDKTQKWITLAENAISKNVKELEYKNAISSTKSEINNNQAAYKKYISYANSLITKAKKNGVTNASAYAKKVRDGSISLQSISNEKILDFVNSYKEMYDKAQECNSAILSLTSQLSELAEAFYNIPIEYAEKKIDTFNDSMDILSAKLNVARTFQNQNNIIDQQTKLQKSIYTAYQTAYKNTSSNLSSAKSKINQTSDTALKGLTSAQKKFIINSVKAGKEIQISPKYSSTLQSALANYNKALEANRVAYVDAQKAAAEYTQTLRDNTKAKYDNITAYYDGKKAIDDSHISKNDAILEYRTAMGYSNTSNAQKSVIENKIKYENERLGFINQELKTYDPAKMKKDYDAKKLSKEDYYSMLQHRQELEEEYYSTQTNLINLNKEIKNLKITHLDYIIDGISSALEKFKNYISLKEVRGDKATETDYTDQIKYEENQIDILYQKYKELEDEKASYAVESEEYKRVTEEQASIENEALQARQNIDDIIKSVNEIRFKPLEDANASLERQIDDFEHLKDILSKDELIDDNGNFTDSGLASIALIGKQMESSKTLIVNYRNGLEKLTESYKNGNLTLDEYNEQSQEYIKSIQDAVSAVDNYRDALIDMYKQQLEAENDTLQKTIDKRKEALQAKKDYYSYDKTIKNANKDINSLKNQIAALEGVGNAAAKAEVERLKSQLSEAEENLEDTKYEHLVELKLTGYDEMSKSADEVLKNLLEDITTNAEMQEKVISNMLDNVVKNYTTAYDTIKKTINETAINTETSNSLSLVDSILTLSDTLTKGFDKIEKTYGDISTGNIYKENDSTSDALGTMVNKPSGGNTDRNIVKLSVSPNKLSMKSGDKKTVKCTVTPSDAKLTVSSLSTKIATASISGNTITVIGVSKGTTTINVSGKNGGATASVEVTVTATTTNVPNPSGGDVKQPTSGGDAKQPTSGGGSTGGNVGSKPPTNTSSHAGLVSNLSGNITSSSSSANIKKVQTALKGLGIKGKDGKALTIDGKWGTNTDYAVKYFQKLNKWTGSLTADGIIGTKTKAKFKKAGYYKGGIVDNVMSLNNQEFLNMLRMNKDDGLITAKLGEGVIPKNIMPNFTQQLEKFNSLPADKILNNINNTTPNLEINIDKFMDVHGNVDKNCVNDLRQLQNDITNNITSTLTKEFRKLGYK